MAKRRITSAELCWLVADKMRQSHQSLKGFSVAIVPGTRGNWTAVVKSRARRLMTPWSTRLLDSIQKELQALYSLADN